MNHAFSHLHQDDSTTSGVEAPSFLPQPNYPPEQPNEYFSHTSAWYEVSCVEAGNSHGHGDAIRSVAFDPLKELIWVGTASGMLHAHYAADMSRIVSSYVSEPAADASIAGDVRDLVISDHAILSAVGYGLAVTSRGGVLRASVRADTVRDAKALALSPISQGHVCMGGESRMLAVVDVEQQRILRQATLRGATGVTDALWISPHGASNVTIFSTVTGRISFCDPSSMREVNALAAFTGPTTSIASSGFYLAATGLGTRDGMSYLEQHVKLFDIRAVGTPLPSVMFSSPPISVTFDSASGGLYDTDGAMWILSPDGLLQLLDISTVSSGAAPYPLSDEIQLDAGSDMLTAMAVSSTGLLALGDSGGFIHQWTYRETVKVNEESEPIWTAPITTEPPPPSMRLDGLLTDDMGATIPKCAIPEFGNGYLTEELFAPLDDHKIARKNKQGGFLKEGSEIERCHDIYPRLSFTRFPLTISDSILRNARRQSFVGYAQAPSSFVRNSTSGHADPPSYDGLRGTERGRITRSVKPFQDQNLNSSKENGTSKNAQLDLTKPAAKSAYVEMDLVAWESIEGFDFLKYNRSALFCGLENALPNMYVNAAVQVLYFAPPMRKALARHSCDREWCISCELGFLFHMFDLGGAGMACEAGNFTRAFMTMANASALGLLDGPHALPLSERIENFTRYLLEQLRKDEKTDEESLVHSLFAAKAISYGMFASSKTPWERISWPFQHTLLYDPKHMNDATFCDLLQNSLFHTLDPTRAFCEAKGQFEIMSHRRELQELPNILLLGCNTKSSEYHQWWFGTDEVRSRATGEGESLDSEVTATDRRRIDDMASAAMRQEKKLVESMRIDISDEIIVTRIEADCSKAEAVYGFDDDGDDNHGYPDTGDKIAEYDLSFIIAHIPPGASDSYPGSRSRGSKRNIEGHLVAYIRVPQEYGKKGKETSESTESRDCGVDSSWWCFNDFVISPCDGFEEVAAFDRRWKKPCLVGYVRRDISSRVTQVSGMTALNVEDVIGHNNHNAAVGLQADEEVPGKGSLLALDCEFVIVGRDEANIFTDGTRQVVIPARMALARVSVIRGSGRLKGTALIDDYVAVREPVVDYVTRFSGLVDGDLDVERSKHKVSSLKSVYKRLRCLVDAGCVFVGHGLKSDFRIINFVVPSQQVVDTVTLFRVGKKRLLGLRFLSNTLLGCDIQSETHDSIEDSDAALRLYEVYVRLKSGENGERRLQRTLKELYAYGYGHSWKWDAEDAFVIDWDW